MADHIKRKIGDAEGVWIKNSDNTDGIILDSITFQKEVKQAKRLKELKLLKEKSEKDKREQEIINVLPQITWILSRSGQIKFFNKRWYEYTGSVNINNLNESWWDTVVINDHNKIKRAWINAKLHGESFELKVRFNTKIESVCRWHKINLAPVYNDYGKVIKWIGTALDIHDQIVQAKRLDAKTTELMAVNHYVDHFIHAVAHDLRAPVSNLKAVFDILTKASEKERGKLITIMDANIHKIDEVLVGLIKVVDAQGNKDSFSYGINVFNIVSEIINNEQDKLTVAQAQVDINIPEDLKINYVKTFLYAILLNLLNNALDFKSPNQNLHIYIKAERVDEDYIKIYFRDNGIGIDMAKNKEKLFKPFVRFSSQKKGMGLGLHIIDVMVKRNGGWVEVESIVDIGTQFLIFLKQYE